MTPPIIIPFLLKSNENIEKLLMKKIGMFITDFF